MALAWRLTIACSSSQKVDHERLFAGWYQERKQQLDRSLVATVRNGDMVTGEGFVQILIRDWGLWLLQMVPSLKHWLEQGSRSEGPTRYIHLPDMPFISELDGGFCFPQTYCVALQPHAEVQFTDDVIFADGKQMFQLVILLDDIEEASSALDDLRKIRNASDRLSLGEATFFVPRTACPASILPNALGHRVFRSATGEEFAQSPLCISRPLPRGYDEKLMWRSVSGKRYILLRFDRFVFAACKTWIELQRATEKLADAFGV